MAFSPVSTQRSVARINITPLVDVMLVLLVIFMMAAPAMTRAIPLDLPQRAPPGTPPPPPREPVALRIDASGGIAWNGDATTLSALPALMRAEAARDPRDQPMLQIDASGDSDYGVLAKVLAAANDAGLRKIGFVRE